MQIKNKNIICIPFAFKKNTNTGVNVKGDIISVYMKNACVALCSAKFYNPECEVSLVTNISYDELPNEYVEILERNKVTITEVPFDEFTFSENYLWSLAFYKLCILKYLCKKEYKNICYMDTDVYVQSNFDPIWNECDENILLYDINHGLQVDDYKIICKEFERYFHQRKLITHYGGEFFASSLENACRFVKHLETVYESMIANNISTTKGDEFLISIAASYMRERIKNAGAYIFRFWTSPGFRLVSTSYEYNPVLILHLPNEKNRGMIRLYDFYIKKGVIPDKKIVWRICRLSSIGLYDRMKILIKKRIKEK